MTYATQQNMIDRFGGDEVIALTDRSNAGVIDVAVLAAALAETDAEIDPYLVLRYSLPLASVPKVITGFACDITRYRLSGANVTETEIVRLRYKDAIKFFESVAAGKISLGLDAAGSAVAETGSVKVSAPARVFNDTSLAGF